MWVLGIARHDGGSSALFGHWPTAIDGRVLQTQAKLVQ
jgi:hypothetical protein